MKIYNSILLIDDDEIANSLHAELLHKLKLTDNIIIQKNGFEAIILLKQLLHDGLHLPDLILLDLNMRVMNGFEFLREFKKMNLHQSPIQVVVLTASNRQRDIVTIESLGIKYLNKPLTKENVLACLEIPAN